MNNTFDILFPPASHARDPQTSRDAAEKHSASGRRGRHAQIVLELVKENPNCTAVELWHLATAAQQRELVELQECRRRLTDLLAANLVVQGDIRVCTIKGSRMVTWRTA